MSLLSTFWKREKLTAKIEPPLVHCTMVPVWESEDDIGNEKRIIGYHCPACGQEFSKEEGLHFMEAERRRLRQEFALDASAKK